MFSVCPSGLIKKDIRVTNAQLSCDNVPKSASLSQVMQGWVMTMYQSQRVWVLLARWWEGSVASSLGAAPVACGSTPGRAGAGTGIPATHNTAASECYQHT